MTSSQRQEKLVTALLWSLAALICVVPAAMIIDLLAHGAGHLSWQFLTEEPRQAGRSGGIASLLLSTLLILLVCLAAVVPLGSACALFLAECLPADSRAGRAISIALDILSGVPSIVFGLFGYLFFTQILGLGFSIAAGGLSLACMVLPLYVRLCEQALRQSPVTYRRAAEALNLSHWGFVYRILLPSAANGIAAAIIIAVGRALAETAVLIFTAGYVTRSPESLLDSGRALSVHIYDLAMNVAGGSKPASATALVLIAMLILINLSARRFARRWDMATR